VRLACEGKLKSEYSKHISHFIFFLALVCDFGISFFKLQKHTLPFSLSLSFSSPSFSPKKHNNMDSYQTRVQTNEIQSQMDKAIVKLETILDENRHPKFIGDVPHSYMDKFKMVEIGANMTCDALLECLEQLVTGDNDPTLVEQIHAYHANARRVMLCFQSNTHKTKAKVEEVKIQTGNMIEKKTLGVKTSTTAEFRTVKEYKWTEIHEWKFYLDVYSNTPGAAPTCVPISSQSIEICCKSEILPPNLDSEIKTQMKTPMEVDVSFLYRNNTPLVQIDRQKHSCRTPVRNEEIARFISMNDKLKNWMFGVKQKYFQIVSSAKNMENKELLCDLEDSSLFVPSFSVLVNTTAPSNNNQSNEANEEKSPLVPDLNLTPDETTRIMTQFQSSMNSSIYKLKYSTTNKKQDMSPHRVFLFNKIGVITNYCMKLITQCNQNLMVVESLLYDQLNKAIGKEITPELVNDFMLIHFQRMFAGPIYQPRAFSYSVRRPKCSQEGVLSIDRGYGYNNQTHKSLFTFCREFPASQDMPHFSCVLNSSTKLKLGGSRMVHAFVQSKFDKSQDSPLFLKARACQFSCFVVMVGTIQPGNSFSAKHAIIVKDKDTLSIPLSLTALPSAKAFRDAISSLSPEQQEFAQMIRCMQLESSLFAVCVVQVKPIMEKVLNLPPNSLTQETALTQSLMTLFMDHQIASELLKFDSELSIGDEKGDLSTPTKLKQVKRNVKNNEDMISDLKLKQLSDKKQQNEYKTKETIKESINTSENLQGLFECSEVMQFEKQSRQVKPEHARVLSCSLQSFKPPAPVGTIFDRIDYNIDCNVPRIQQQSFQEEDANDYDCEQSASFSNNNGDDNKQELKREEVSGNNMIESKNKPLSDDWTQFPIALDRALLASQTNHPHISSALCAGEITAKAPWTRCRFDSMLQKDPISKMIYDSQKEVEKNKAFDLLDVLSRNGEDVLDNVEMHILCGSVHQFDLSLTDMVVKQNVNPILPIQQSALLFVSQLFEVENQANLLSNPKFLLSK
jgi:hypothetical protein